MSISRVWVDARLRLQLALAITMLPIGFPATAATIRDAYVQTWVFQGEPMLITADGQGFGPSGTLNVKVTPKGGGTAVFPIQAPNPGRWLFTWRDQRIELGFSPQHTSEMRPGSYTFQLEARPASSSASANSRKFDILVLPRRANAGLVQVEFSEGRVAFTTSALSSSLETLLPRVPFKVDKNDEVVVAGVGFKVNEGKSRIKKVEIAAGSISVDLEVELKVKVDSPLAKWSGSISLSGRVQLRPEARNDSIIVKSATDGFRLRDTGSMPGAIKGAAETLARRFADDKETSISRLVEKELDKLVNGQKERFIGPMISCWKRGFVRLESAELRNREFRLGYAVILDPDGRGFACVADLYP